MNLPAEQLETVVREVMRRLAAEPAGAVRSTVGGQLRIGQHVVTTAALDGRLAGVSHLFVNADAIVTPAVVDLLKDKSIELTRGSSVRPGETVRLQKVLLASDRQQAKEQTLVERLTASGNSVRTAQLSNYQTLGAMLGPDEVAVVLADKPFEAACFANRDSRVCAIHVSNSAECIAAMSQVNANVLVLEPVRGDDDLIATYLNAVGRQGAEE